MTDPTDLDPSESGPSESGPSESGPRESGPSESEDFRDVSDSASDASRDADLPAQPVESQSALESQPYLFGFRRAAAKVREFPHHPGVDLMKDDESRVNNVVNE